MFVRDGFYFWAFLLAPLWMLLHRLWLVLLAIVVVVGVDGAAALCRRVRRRSFVIGAADRRCWSASRRHAAALDAGAARLDERRRCHRRRSRSRRARFFARLDATRDARPHAGAARRRAGSPPSARAAAVASDVIGLFPAARSAAGERRHRRLRLRQSALGRKGVRARRARSRHRRSRSW